MRIAYFGYDIFIDCFKQLKQDDHKICRIFTFPCDNKRYNFNLQLKDAAQEDEIEIIERKVTKTDIDLLVREQVELIVVAGYQYIIPISLGMPPTINIHPTLLPEGRGQWPLPWIILNDLKISGVTIHKLIAEMDAGDILIQESFLINERETLESLTKKVQQTAQTLLRQTTNNFCFLWQNARLQQGTPTRWSMPSLQDRTLDWNLSVDEIDRIARAFGNFDSCCIFDEKEWIVQKVEVWEEVHTFKPGTIIDRTAGIVIAVKNGFVRLVEFEEDLD